MLLGDWCIPFLYFYLFCVHFYFNILTRDCLHAMEITSRSFTLHAVIWFY